MDTNIIIFTDHSRDKFNKNKPNQRFILLCLPRKKVKWRAGKAMRKPQIYVDHAQRLVEMFLYPWQVWCRPGRNTPHSPLNTDCLDPQED